jgi:hypothetical protein
MCQNAEYQLKAHLLGKVTTLTAGETRMASTLNALPNVTNRTWEYWTLRLDKAAGLPPKPASKARPRAASVRGKTSGNKTSGTRIPSRGGARRKKGRTR